MNETYYKVVSKLNGELVSARASKWFSVERDSFSLSYEVDEWTEPKVAGSKIFIFSNL